MTTCIRWNSRFVFSKCHVTGACLCPKRLQERGEERGAEDETEQARGVCVCVHASMSREKG